MKKKIYFLLLLAFVGLCTSTNAQYISTVAGSGATGFGNGGFAGDGGPATAAQLNNPTSMVADASGNLYIADSENSRIRKVTASTGIITTIAGTGVAGFSGDGGLATFAQLNKAYAVAVDATGNVFIADKSNNRIRKITASTGIISTFAGGGATFGNGVLATSTTIGNPVGIAVDATGNVYYSDLFNSQVRKVTVSTNIVTTIAGGGAFSPTRGDGGLATSAYAGSPFGLCVAPNGDVYFADSDYIRKVTVSTGIITSLAGTGTWGFGGDGGLATLAQFNNPNAVSLDANGNIYIADVGNSRVRKITVSTGIMSTFAGSGASGTGSGGFSGDGGFATVALMLAPNLTFFDANGGMFIAEQGNHRIRYVSNCANSVINPSTLVNGTLNTAYTQTLSQTGFLPTPITGLSTWSVSVGTLPVGLSLVSGTGIISGTPTATGTSNFTIQLVSGGCLQTKAYTIVINAPVSICPTITFSTVIVTTGIVGTAYSLNAGATASSGTLGYTIAPALPTGLTFNVTTGAISGTPTTVTALNSYTVTATTSATCNNTKLFTFAIDAATQNPTTAIDNSLSNLVKVSPNPSNGDFQVDFSGLNVAKSLVRVYDAQGKQVLSSVINANANTTISLDKMPNGLYLLEIETTKGRILKRLIKEN